MYNITESLLRAEDGKYLSSVDVESERVSHSVVSNSWRPHGL